MGHWTLVVDGRPVEVRCRADLLVTRRGRRFVAEVKSGAHHGDPTAPHTRRQLLEYQRAFAVDGFIVVDMARRHLHRVDLDPP
jgi:hypothetical protein